MVTLHLPPELEMRLRNEAAREGLDADAYIVRTLERTLPSSVAASTITNLSRRESELLEKIGIGLSEDDWRRYRDLEAKCDDETLTPAEQQEFIATSHRIERANARRMSHLIELAALRRIPLEQLMDELGLGNGKEAGGGQDRD
jgi:hypothetical protein